MNQQPKNTKPEGPDNWLTRITIDELGDGKVPGREIVVLEIPRECIETLYLASTLEKLHALTDTKKRVLNFRESVLFTVLGYDGDPRELPEIPEVRAFFRAVTEEWPHWVWFINRESGQMQTLFLLLCDSSVVSRVPGQVSYNIEPSELSIKLGNLTERALSLFVSYDIPENDVESSIQSAMECLGL